MFKLSLRVKTWTKLEETTVMPFGKTGFDVDACDFSGIRSEKIFKNQENNWKHCTISLYGKITTKIIMAWCGRNLQPFF